MLRGDWWYVRIEEDDCDIKAEKGGAKLAVEVETGKRKKYDHILRNLKRDLKWADRVVIVCPNKQIEQKISQLVRDKSENTDVFTYSEFKLSNIFTQ
ncbi:MAG: hypothetical protein JSV56_12245 [Methanomassiliicoccales archaeon]|nr:MAG: hypothetical protein JSV56_12245 [Methanomassiliicoccales archaeon]